MREKITRDEYAAAYKLARLVIDGNRSRQWARGELKKLGLNETSADFFIGNLQCMLKGHIYRKAMSAEATDAFLSWILQDYDEAALDRAVTALRLHIPYYRTSTSRPGKLKPAKKLLDVLRKYEKFGSVPTSVLGVLNDLEKPPDGETSPDRAKRIISAFKRNDRVRAFVALRSEGRCEYCGCEGFKLPNSRRYIETHHIISLANQGPDTVENVIALCPNHHREAHYGVDAENLEVEFQKRLSVINTRRLQ
jgi:5-methylcytosine-specific restriction endonuclease McrA